VVQVISHHEDFGVFPSVSGKPYRFTAPERLCRVGRGIFRFPLGPVRSVPRRKENSVAQIFLRCVPAGTEVVRGDLVGSRGLHWIHSDQSGCRGRKIYNHYAGRHHSGRGIYEKTDRVSHVRCPCSGVDGPKALLRPRDACYCAPLAGVSGPEICRLISVMAFVFRHPWWQSSAAAGSGIGWIRQSNCPFCQFGDALWLRRPQPPAETAPELVRPSA
jgi:hypothetical protein